MVFYEHGNEQSEEAQKSRYLLTKWFNIWLITQDSTLRGNNLCYDTLELLRHAVYSIGTTVTLNVTFNRNCQFFGRIVTSSKIQNASLGNNTSSLTENRLKWTNQYHSQLMEHFSILEGNLEHNGEVSFSSFNSSCRPDKFTVQTVSHSRDINPITRVKFPLWCGTTAGSLMALLSGTPACSFGSACLLLHTS
jgi:hypothetical protein